MTGSGAKQFPDSSGANLKSIRICSTGRTTVGAA